MFIPPTSPKELKKLKWSAPDIILVTGDSYIDSPFIGVAILARYLNKKGFKTAVIAQPDINSSDDILRLGEPRLFWGVSGGSLDSMVANYTATGKKRINCDYTPGGKNDKRPDRAVIVYTNLIKRFSETKKPVVLGGIEASLRRIAHYDFWNNKIRKPVIFDSKADFLIYGMAEKTLLSLAQKLKKGKSPLKLSSLCYIAKSVPENVVQLESFEAVKNSKEKYADSFMTFYNIVRTNQSTVIAQKCGERFVIINPPDKTITSEDLDEFHNLEFSRDLHPYYRKYGKVKALETIRHSIVTHRGCYGECNFCAIALHQGRSVKSRSPESVLEEVKSFTNDTTFKGIIKDVGGPSANMYAIDCKLMRNNKNLCDHRSCIYPDICPNLNLNHQKQITLLNSIIKNMNVKKAFVSSGIRYDMINADKINGEKYLSILIERHISGQMKIAPEHISFNILKLMKKPGKKSLSEFRKTFERLKKKLRKNLFLTYYFIAAHPGSGTKEMLELKRYVQNKLKINPEQVQVFTPTPLTLSSLIYWTERDPFTNKKVFVEKNISQKNKQKSIITG